VSAKSTVPVIADFDDGFGGVLNVRHAVNKYRQAGASAFHIEDQTHPKRCGQLDGVTVVPIEEMVAKIRAAVDARGDEDIDIIARTDSFRTEGIERVIERGRCYIEAGADAFFPEPTAMTVDDLKAIGQAIEAPLVIAMVEGANAPFLSAAELAALGFSCVLFPNALLRSFGKTGRKVLQALAADGTTASVLEEMLSFKELMSLLDYDGMRQWEKQWATGMTP
jgi:2,3-dimethylmalate lyase